MTDDLSHDGLNHASQQESTLNTFTRLVVTSSLLFVCTSVAMAQGVSGARVPRPGMIVSSTDSPISVTPTGITGRVVSYYGEAVKGTWIVVSLVRWNYETGGFYADSATAKKFGPCVGGVQTNCVSLDGNYRVSESALPTSDDLSNQSRQLDVRAEAHGWYHPIWAQSQVWVNGGVLAYAPYVTMYPIGTKVGTPYIWWDTDKTVTVGMWINSNWETGLDIQFKFAGSSWTKSQTEYDSTTVRQNVQKGSSWIQQRFWGPHNATFYYGGTFCVRVQVTYDGNQEWVLEQTEPVCVPLKDPAVIPTSGGGGKG